MQQEKAPIITIESKVSAIECPAFNLLDQKNKLYAYHFTRACWAGAKICYFQRSYEAPGLFYLLQKVFLKQIPQEIKTLLVNNNFSEVEVQQLFTYISAFFQNCGNFLSFGDSKFIPELSQDKFTQFLQLSQAYKDQQEDFDKIWNLISKYIYTYEKPFGLIDLLEKDGSNSYYSPNISKDLIEELDKFLHTKNLSELNTRIVLDGNKLILLVASSIRNDEVELGEVQGKKVVAIYGDFKSFLGDLVNHLKEAQKYAANENQTNMIEQYIKHFETGDIELHKESQKHWINDKGPIIETNIGFIETYLDPMKVRAEFEGFVSVVNQEESKLLANLVEQAEEIIKTLPWPKEYEIEKFSRPDFTSLEILAFACSGTPVGINIPNYDDIRQNIGFKNVNLGNVYGKPNRDNVRFIQGTDIDLFVNYYKESLFVVVALHELIGHGSGKLFIQDADGKLNFENVINPFTQQPVTTFYNSKEHWHAKFGELSGAYEECRADSVALYLSTNDDVVKILLPNQNQEQRIETVKAAWLDIIIGALKGLQYYSVEQTKWGQPHILASYVIFQALIQKDPNFVKFNFSQLNDKDYFTIDIDYDKIWTVGKEAIGDLLKGLQVYKSIADGEGGMQFFNQFTKVDENMIKLRKIVMDHKQPRRIELQPDVKLNNDSVELLTFNETHEGVIQSHIVHYQGNVEDVKDEFLGRQQYFKN